MFKVKNPAKKLTLSLVVYALVLLLAASSAVASNPASLSLNGQVVSTNVVVEDGVSSISATSLATITGVAIAQEGNVPIRQFFEARGGEVEWDSQNWQVVVLWEDHLGDDASNNDEQQAAADRTAYELLIKTDELLRAANTYRMSGAMSIDVNMSMAGEVLEAQQMEIAIEGVFRYTPLAMHMKMSIDLSGILAELSPEEIAMLGLDSGTMVTETVLVNGVVYTKLPGFDQWVIEDLSGAGDIMEELNSMLQLTPHQAMDMVSQLGITSVLGADAVVDGVEFYTVRNHIDSAAFRSILNDMLGGLSLESMMPAGVELSEEEQMAIAAMLETMEVNMSFVTYINKATLMSEHMSMVINMNLSLPTPEGTASVVMSMNGYFDLYDFGTELQLPDVSNAITLEQLMNMMQ